MNAVKVLPKGQITLPKRIRKLMNINIGDSLIILEESDDKIVLKKGKTIHDFKDFLPKPDIPIEEMIEKATEEIASDRKFADAVMGYWGLARGLSTVYTYDAKDFKKIKGLAVKTP